MTPTSALRSGIGNGHVMCQPGSISVPLIVHKSKSGGGPPLFKTLARWLHHLRARAKPMSLPKDRKSFKAC